MVPFSNEGEPHFFIQANVFRREVEVGETKGFGVCFCAINEEGAQALSSVLFVNEKGAQPGVEVSSANKIIGDQARTSDYLVFVREQIPLG